MIKPDSPKQLALDILKRSVCRVQVGAVCEDASGRIISWGWNSVGSGEGEHAECAAIRRANKNRLWYGTIYIAAWRKGGGKAKLVTSKPCDKCQQVLDNWNMDVVYRDGNGKWIRKAGV